MRDLKTRSGLFLFWKLVFVSILTGFGEAEEGVGGEGFAPTGEVTGVTAGCFFITLVDGVDEQVDETGEVLVDGEELRGGGVGLCAKNTTQYLMT